MNVVFDKYQCDAFFSLMSNIVMQEEDESGYVKYKGKMLYSDMKALNEIGTQIIQNSISKTHMEKKRPLGKICRDCVFFMRKNNGTYTRFYCTKIKSKRKDKCKYKRLYAKDDACALYKPTSTIEQIFDYGETED